MIPSSFYDEVLQKCCRVKTNEERGSSFGIFRSTKRGQLPAMRITDQPLLLTRRKNNRPGYKFCLKTSSQISYSSSFLSSNLKVRSGVEGDDDCFDIDDVDDDPDNNI